MAISVAGSGSKRGRATPEMNVTPLVDVVLVLLIIFMVVTPLLAKQFWLQLPKDEAVTPPSTDNRSVVLTIAKDGTIQINGADVDRSELRARVARIMAARSEKVLYFDAADDAPYATTVQAMDLARQGGARSIAILTHKVVR
jgi:biopolymer transport protein ExbD/biopolymer transport protein TolR